MGLSLWSLAKHARAKSNKLVIDSSAYTVCIPFPSSSRQNTSIPLPIHVYGNTLLCLTSRTTVTSARIPKEDACHRSRNLYVFSRVQRGTPRLTHTGCVLQRAFLDAISDVTVVLGMRQSIYNRGTLQAITNGDCHLIALNISLHIFYHLPIIIVHSKYMGIFLVLNQTRKEISGLLLVNLISLLLSIKMANYGMSRQKDVSIIN